MNKKLFLIPIMFIIIFQVVNALTVYSPTNTVGFCDTFSAGVCSITITKTYTDDIRVENFTRINIANTIIVQTSGAGFDLNFTNVGTIAGTGTATIQIGSSATDQTIGNLFINLTNSISLILINTVAANRGVIGNGMNGNIITLHAPLINQTTIIGTGGQPQNLGGNQNQGGIGSTINIYSTLINQSAITSTGGMGGHEVPNGRGGAGGTINITSTTIKGTTINSLGGNGFDNGHNGAGCGGYGGTIIIKSTILDSASTIKTTGGVKGNAFSDHIVECAFGGSPSLPGIIRINSTNINSASIYHEAESGATNQGTTIIYCNQCYLHDLRSVIFGGIGGSGGYGNISIIGNRTILTNASGDVISIVANRINQTKNFYYDTSLYIRSSFLNQTGVFTGGSANINVNNRYDKNNDVTGTNQNYTISRFFMRDKDFGANVKIKSNFTKIYSNYSGSGTLKFITCGNISQFIPYFKISTPSTLLFNYTNIREGSLLFDSVIGANDLLFKWSLIPAKKVEFAYSSALTLNEWTCSAGNEPSDAGGGGGGGGGSSGAYNSSMLFNTPVFELAYQSIVLRIPKYVSHTTSAVLNYSGSIKTNVKTNNGTHDIYNSTFITPINTNITENQINYIRWSFNVINSTGTFNFTFNQSQSVRKIQVNNCSGNFTSPRAINVTIYNEDTATIIPNAVLGGNLQVFIASPSLYRTFNLTWTPRASSSYTICIKPSNAIYTTNAQFEYSKTAFNPKTYYFTQTILNSAMKNISLYLTPNTSLVLFRVFDTDQNMVPNIFIDVLSYNFPTNSYKTTEVLKTANDGTAFGQIVLFDRWYKFILRNSSNDKLFESSPIKITTTTKDFFVNLHPDGLKNYKTTQKAQCGLTFSNITNNFVWTYTEGTQTMTQGCLKVVKRTFGGNDVLVANSCSTSKPSGTVIVNIGNTTGIKATFIGSGSLYFGSERNNCDPLSVTFSNLWQLYKPQGLMFAFIIVLTLAMVGIWSPIASVILSIAGLIVSISLGLIFINYVILIGLIIVGGIAVFRMSSK